MKYPLLKVWRCSLSLAVLSFGPSFWSPASSPIILSIKKLLSALQAIEFFFPCKLLQAVLSFPRKSSTVAVSVLGATSLPAVPGWGSAGVCGARGLCRQSAQEDAGAAHVPLVRGLHAHRGAGHHQWEKPAEDEALGYADSQTEGWEEVKHRVHVWGLDLQSINIVGLHRATKQVSVEADLDQPTHRPRVSPAFHSVHKHTTLWPRVASEVGRWQPQGHVYRMGGLSVFPSEVGSLCTSTKSCLHLQLSGLQQQEGWQKWHGWPCCLLVLLRNRSVIAVLICRPPIVSRDLAVVCWWPFYLLTGAKTNQKICTGGGKQNWRSPPGFNWVSLCDAVHIGEAF